MSQPTLKERVAALEKEVARLSSQLRPDGEPGRDDWKSVVGMFANDPIMKEIQEEGRKIREADRRRAKKQSKQAQFTEMIILDTDHVNVLQKPEHSQYAILSAKMKESTNPIFATTVISLEEQVRGWLAAIHRARKVHNQILYYTRLVGMIRFFGEWRILPFNEPAADRFEALRKERIRIGTMDLKIAAIAQIQGALLLSANLRDFERVPGLRVENWLH